jgi:tRNA-modifying protein YgfZ
MPTSCSAETLSIEGADAMAFAHAQFSSKVSSLAIGQWQFSAWLDPQGRVRALFHLLRVADDRFLLLLRGGDATTMVDALRRFVFRSKLALNALPARALATGPALPMHAVDEEDGTLLLGCGTHSLHVSDSEIGDTHWQWLQLRAGWPWLPTQALSELLPAALSLQRLQAVAVDKGCYPGQEIVARLHFRGGHKRHLHSVTLSQPVRAGDVLRDDDRDVGCVLGVVIANDSVEALVVLSDDVAARADEDRSLSLDGNLAVHLRSSWPA